MVGGLIMAHGDDAGLRLPPRLAPIQVVVLVVRDEEGVGERGRRAGRGAAHRRACASRVDDRIDVGFGRRAIDWELKGVPVRIELGPRDLASGAGHRRAPRRRRARPPSPSPGCPPHVADAARRPCRPTCSTGARTRRDDRTVDVATVDEAVEAARTGFARIPWAAPRRRRARPSCKAEGVTRPLPPGPRRRRRPPPTTSPRASPSSPGPTERTRRRPSGPFACPPRGVPRL